MTETRMTPELWRLDDDQLAALVATRERVLAREYTATLAVVAEMERRGLAREKGYRDTAALLVDAARLSPREARARVAQAGRSSACSGPARGTSRRSSGPRTSGACWTPPGRRRRGRWENVAARIARYWDQDGKAPEDERREQADPLREFRYHTGRHGRMRFSGELDPEAAAQPEGLLGPLAKPQPADPVSGLPDPRSTARRQGDALAEIIDLAARTDELAVQGGERAVIIASVTLAELESRTRRALLEVPGCTSLDQLRRLACAARVVPAVFGNDGGILYLGRSSRDASPAQRRALALRDKGCARPGCTRKPKCCCAAAITGRSTTPGGPSS
ncbi:DUF222 domain-containing protein [Amycolatopsis aidingensis]|uniref:DUF222 domain-containing protein n=1 Tax=Amycolatopsis aidingensis TaxID=2842453 RepID=UPI001E62346C|nr:DUF222 domain-containing protein [Amycolatopsis aidingensis]